MCKHLTAHIALITSLNLCNSLGKDVDQFTQPVDEEPSSRQIKQICPLLHRKLLTLGQMFLSFAPTIVELGRRR